MSPLSLFMDVPMISTEIQTLVEKFSTQFEKLSLDAAGGWCFQITFKPHPCRDWKGARPHLELIAADATLHKEMGCLGVGMGGVWGISVQRMQVKRLVYVH